MKYIIIIFCFGVSLVSCQKEFPSVDNLLLGGQTNNQLLNDSNKLIMYADLDTTLPVGSDTIVVQTYNYDMNKRLVKSNYKEFPGYGFLQEEVKLSYNGSDTTPFLKTAKINYLGTLSFDTTYYFYSAGKRISDSTPSGYSVRHYTYGPNRIIEMINGYPPRDIYFIKNGGNTITQNDTLSGGGTASNFSFTYDNKKNPFYGLFHTSADRDYPYYEMETYPEEMIFEKNNPIDINETQGSQFHFLYSYEYKANGYPAVARAKDADDPTTFFKRIFKYTRLS